MLLNDVNTITKKKELLGVSGELSDVEKLYSLNALRIFKERYLLRVQVGTKVNPKTGKEEPIFETVERLDDLFKRVAVASGIMEILYDPLFYDKEGKQKINYEALHNIEKQLKENIDRNKNIDYRDLDKHVTYHLPNGFNVNYFHMDQLVARHIELVKEGKSKVTMGDISCYLINERQLIIEKYLPIIQKYYDLMANNIFLPNTPCLMNAGTKLNQNAACFTLDVTDSMRGISKLWGDVADIFKSGGGIGVNYSKLRPEGAYVSTTGGIASGPISWLRITDAVTGEVKQGGKRRGASMGILNMDHPDIEKFIDLKDNKTLHNHNISICTSNSYFKSLVDNYNDHPIGSDTEEKFLERKNNKRLMDKITNNVWKTGDPGMVFLENMNSNNLLRDVLGYDIDVTNPCSEISMYPYESCILASINLTKFIDKNGKFDLEKFIDVSRTVTAFLDGIIDATNYPLEEINEMTKKCRRVGTGFMGLADVLTMLKIPYNSREGFLFAEFVSAVMTMSSLLESNRQAKVKGAFPLWYDERYPKYSLPVNYLLQVVPSKEFYKERNELTQKIRNISKYFDYFDDTRLDNIIIDAIDILGDKPIIRNCSVTTIAPTGTLSMFSDCSSALEPNFSNVFTKNVTLGSFVYANKYLESALREEGIYSQELINKIENNGGSVQGIDEIPEWIKQVFVTAMDIHPFDHIMMQSVCQRWISNGIAKTINVPEDFDPKLIEYCYVLAWALGNKGTTVYRDNSKDEQVLNNSSKHKVGILNTSYYTYNYIAIELWVKEKLLQSEEYCTKILDACYPSSNKSGMIKTVPTIWEERHTKIVEDYEERKRKGEVKEFVIIPSKIGIWKTDIDVSEMPDTSTPMFIECKNCGNKVMTNSNSKACFLCFNCGGKIGNCE